MLLLEWRGFTRRFLLLQSVQEKQSEWQGKNTNLQHTFFVQFSTFEEAKKKEKKYITGMKTSECLVK